MGFVGHLKGKSDLEKPSIYKGPIEGYDLVWRKHGKKKKKKNPKLSLLFSRYLRAIQEQSLMRI